MNNCSFPFVDGLRPFFRIGSFAAVSLAPAFLSASIVFQGGVWVGGNNAGNPVTFNAGSTASGIDGATVNPANPHTFATYQGIEFDTTLDVAVTDAMSQALVVGNLHLFGVNGGGLAGIDFTLLNAVSAGSSIAVTANYSQFLGAWETPGGASPTSGSNAPFSSGARLILPGGTTLADYNDVVFDYDVTGNLQSPDGAPTPFDWNTVGGNIGNASGVAISGGLNESLSFNFAGGIGADTTFNAFARDTPGNAGASQVFTDQVTWTLNAGAQDIPAGSRFRISFDGTVIPEPSSLGLVSLLGCCLLFRISRGRVSRKMRA